jgi:enoyl-CoA hydratase/carnithine racemase
VITGSGEKAFCSGFDVRSIPTEVTAENAIALRNRNPLEQMLNIVKNYPYPTIAMLNGHAMGAGFNMAMCCDIRIAADDVRMSIPPAKLGLVYHPEGIKQVVEALGMPHAREVFFTGRLYSAEDVREMGLVHHSVPKSKLSSITYELAEEIAANAPLSLKGIKRILNMFGNSMALSEENMKEAAALIAQAFNSADLKEGQLAFIQKRKPDFKGR